MWRAKRAGRGARQSSLLLRQRKIRDSVCPLHRANARSPSPALRAGADKRSRSRGAIRARVFAKAVARMERSAIREQLRSLNAHPGFHFVQSGLQKREAERRQTHGDPVRIKRMRRASDGTRSPVGVPPRLLPGGSRPFRSAPGQASCDVARAHDPKTPAPTEERRPALLTRALPAPACPSPGKAPPAPAVIPARMMPEAARERSVSLRARAPLSLRFREYPRPKASLDERDSWNIVLFGDGCQEFGLVSPYR
jgi:hypothetical protein